MKNFLCKVKNISMLNKFTFDVTNLPLYIAYFVNFFGVHWRTILQFEQIPWQLHIQCSSLVLLYATCTSIWLIQYCTWFQCSWPRLVWARGDSVIELEIVSSRNKYMYNIASFCTSMNRRQNSEAVSIIHCPSVT